MRRLTSILAAACTLPLALTLTATAAQAAGAPHASSPRAGISSQAIENIDSNGPTGYCLQDGGDNLHNFAPVTIWGCPPGTPWPQMIWDVNASPSGIGYQIKLHGTGYCLSSNGNSGTQLVMYSCDTSAAQGWVYRALSGTNNLYGSYSNALTGNCMDNRLGRLVNGNPVQSYTCNSTWSQIWGLFAAL